MSLLSDFRSFALKGNIVDLAVAVVIGGAFGKIVTAIVSDLIMPLVGAVLPSGEWRTFTVTPLKLQVGHLIGEVVDFGIIAFVLFLVTIKLMGALKRKHEAAPATHTCPECLETIPVVARRCKACGQPVSAPGPAAA
jgi:large conductance mechanosensitive channel